MTVHRQQNEKPNNQYDPLSAHLRTCAKDKENCFTLFPFNKFADNTTEQERTVKESEFITKYRPKLKMTVFVQTIIILYSPLL